MNRLLIHIVLALLVVMVFVQIFKYNKDANYRHVPMPQKEASDYDD